MSGNGGGYADDLEYRGHRSRGVGMPLVFRPELDSGIRLDGRFEGPKTDTSCVWQGRAPTLPDGTPFPSLVLSAGTGNGVAAPIGTTVTIHAEAAAGGGGRTFREFEVGYGLTAELMVGYYDWMRVRTAPGSVIPEGFTLFFVWSLELFSGTRLTKFVNYPVMATIVPVPEGADEVIPELACIMTFQFPSFGTTFARVVAAGERIPILGPAFSCNIPNKFVFRLKPM